MVFRQIIRILETDLKGEIPVAHALSKVKGISYMMANALCKINNIPNKKKIGDLSDEEVKAIEGTIKSPGKLPSWLLNRRKDIETGQDLHLTTSQLKLRREFDVKELQKIKSYRGIRHAQKLPLRGQRTRSHFRKKGKGRAIGVMKKAVRQAQAKAEKK